MVEKVRKIIGYQVADATGQNIQGDEPDPSGLTSFEVMDEASARRFAAAYPEFAIQAIHDGDIEDPSFETWEPPIAA